MQPGTDLREVRLPRGERVGRVRVQWIPLRSKDYCYHRREMLYLTMTILLFEGVEQQVFQTRRSFQRLRQILRRRSTTMTVQSSSRAAVAKLESFECRQESQFRAGT